MRNVTLSADEDLIERARLRALHEKTTLNAAFREWLQRYAGPTGARSEYADLMKRLEKVQTTRRFSRHERTER